MLKTYSKPDWWPKESWEGKPVIVVAAGPSANLYDYEPYRDRAKFIVVNNSRELVPWADVLIASDGDWWHNNDGAKDFKGLKLTLDWSITQQYPNVHLIRISKIHPGITIDRPAYVGVGLNSGFYAINMAVQFLLMSEGARVKNKLILSGFDMNMINGVHWHGRHKSGANNPNNDKLGRWKKILDHQSKALKDFGIEVINVCMTSSLKNYPKMSLEEAFQK